VPQPLRQRKGAFTYKAQHGQQLLDHADHGATGLIQGRGCRSSADHWLTGQRFSMLAHAFHEAGEFSRQPLQVQP
jgi:hypothetical protein